MTVLKWPGEGSLREWNEGNSYWLLRNNSVGLRSGHFNLLWLRLPRKLSGWRHYGSVEFFTKGFNKAWMMFSRSMMV